MNTKNETNVNQIGPILWALPNNLSSDVEAKFPWNTPNICDQHKTKSSFRKFYEESTSQGCVFNGCEGVNPHMRITTDNPVFRIHGAVADFDGAGVGETEDLAELANSSKLPHAPTHIARSFGDGIRAVWMFEKPVLVVSNKHAQAFLLEFNRAVAPRFLCKGLDKKSWVPTMYFERGRTWTVTKAKPVSLGTLSAIQSTASAKIRWKSMGACTIPIAAVAAEAKKRGWPWRDGWGQNDHCSRFWDPAATNQRGGMIRESGVQCFTGEKPWKSWQEIFGQEFVNHYAADVARDATQDVHFIGSESRFYVKSDRGVWLPYYEGQIKRRLMSAGVDGSRYDGELSDVEQALVTLEREALTGVQSRFDKLEGPFYEDKQAYLNTRAPSHILPKEGDWSYISSFLDHTMGDARGYFLQWLKRFYEGILDYSPNRGQVLFLGGDVECGKTLLNRVIIGSLVGGYADPTNYITGASRFNDNLFDKALWCIDDGVVDDRHRRRYTSLLKTLAVNSRLSVEGKGKKEYEQPWQGRLVITHNMDDESLSILPDADESIREKVSLLRMNGGFKFGEDPSERIHKELPAFAYYLTEMAEDYDLRVTTRFGIKSQQDATIMSLHNLPPKTTELVASLERVFKGEPELEEISGNAVDILEQLRLHLSDTRLSPSAVGMGLGKLRSMGVDIEMEVGAGGVKRYTIKRANLFA